MKYRITLNNRLYEVEVEVGEALGLDAYEAIAPAPAAAPVAASAPAATPATAPAAPAVTGNGEAINAPLPGTVLRVNVKAGDQVKEGQVLLILEAMKMENEIMAPKNGTVTQVVIAKGATVETGAPLVVLA